jgi:hypothetical protein
MTQNLRVLLKLIRFYQNKSHTTPQPCPYTQGQHNTDGLLWRNTIITGLHRNVLINRKILLFLIKHILNASVITLTRQCMWSVSFEVLVAIRWWLSLVETCKNFILLLKYCCTWWDSILISLICYANCLKARYHHAWNGSRPNHWTSIPGTFSPDVSVTPTVGVPAWG